MTCGQSNTTVLQHPERNGTRNSFPTQYRGQDPRGRLRLVILITIILGPSLTSYVGTWQSKPGEVRKAVEFALRDGYRHIDAAL